jgi:hypothetical protein
VLILGMATCQHLCIHAFLCKASLVVQLRASPSRGASDLLPDDVLAAFVKTCMKQPRT